MHLALRYALFAALATLLNIGAQDAVVRLYFGPYDVLLSVIVGTGTGLVFKYVLDKRYIFRFRTTGAAHDGKLFVLYTLMGLLTTAVFWAVEFGFQALFHDKWMRYFGGALGLIIGYLTKYRLDKRFVFLPRNSNFGQKNE